MTLSVVTDFNPVGSSLRWSPAEVGRLAVVTPALRRAAVILLLRIGWSPAKHSRRTLDQWLALLIALLSNRIDALTESMAAGEVGLEAWQEGVGEVVREGYVAATVLGADRAYLALYDDLLATGDVPASSATGPLSFLRAKVEAQTSSELRFSLGRLERFARTAEAGITLTNTEAQAIARGRLYAHYAKAPFYLARNEERKEAGLTEQSNVLGAGEHCIQCLEITAKGWVPIGSLPPPSKRLCGSRCKCRWQYR